MTAMMAHREAGKVPDVVRLIINGRAILARRRMVGELQVIGQSIQVADSAWVDEVPPLPVTVENDAYPVYSYEWSHARGPISVCVVIPFRPQGWATTRRLRIVNDIRPDLTKGIIVDTSEITIQSGNKLILPSGLGDGYYPIFENRNLGIQTQSLVIDFKVWEKRNYGVGHYTFDEYGLPSIEE